MKISLTENYGYILRAKRKDLKLSQLDCAKEIGVSDKYIRNIELCKISSVILDYANLIDLSLLELLNIEFSDERSHILFKLIMELENKKTERKE